VLTGVKGFCLFILPIAASVFAVVFGVILTVRKIRAKRLVFAGIGALAFLIIYFSFSFIYFTVFNNIDSFIREFIREFFPGIIPGIFFPGIFPGSGDFSGNPGIFPGIRESGNKFYFLLN
jgi:hypothetical protein